MKVAVVGSRNFAVKDLGSYLPSETTEIISGGAKGVEHKVFSDLDGLIRLAFDEITEKELEEFLSLDVSQIHLSPELDKRIINTIKK